MTPLLPELTDREEAVLELECDGLTDAEVGHRLGIGERTVRAHLAAARDKLGANSTKHAVALYVRARMVSAR